MKPYAFGVDIGGTTVKIGLFTTAGELLEKWEIPTRIENNGEQVLPDVAASIRAKLGGLVEDENDVGGFEKAMKRLREKLGLSPIKYIYRTEEGGRGGRIHHHIILNGGIDRDALEKLKGLQKSNAITEDDQAGGEKKIQKLTDNYCKEIDNLSALKEKEILEI